MSLIESNVRGDGRLSRDTDRCLLASNRGDPVSVSVVVSADEEGSYALSAAELATIESEKTKEKLRTKADHVSPISIYCAILACLPDLPFAWRFCNLQLAIRVSHSSRDRHARFHEQTAKAPTTREPLWDLP